MQSPNTQCPHNHRILFAAVAVDIQRNSFGNSGTEAVADPAVLLGHMLVVDSLFVGNLWLPGIPGCSCSIGCMPQYHTVAVAAVGCNLTEILFVGADCSCAGCSSVGYVACAVDMTDFDGRKIDADDNRRCHHSLHHHNPLTKKNKQTNKQTKKLVLIPITTNSLFNTQVTFANLRGQTAMVSTWFGKIMRNKN